MTCYSRRISGIERGYLHIATRGPHPTIHTVIDFDGTVPAETWHHASGVATAANPGMAVVRRSRRWAHNSHPCPVVFHEWVDDPNDVKEFHDDINLVTGPVTTVHVFQDEDRTRVVLAASHAVTDGRGMERFLVDLLAAVDGREPVGSPDVETDVEAARSLGASSRPQPNVTRRDPVRSPLGGKDNHRHWTSRAWPSAPGAMSARIGAAVARMIDHPVMVIIPVDLRRHLPHLRSTANLSAQLPLTIQPGQPWKSIHGHLLMALARKHDLAMISEDFRQNNPFTTTLVGSQTDGLDGNFPCAAIISDHGKLDISRFRTSTLTPVAMHSLPMLVPYSGMFISSSTVNDATTVTIAHRLDDDPQIIDTFFDLINDQMAD
ncbi:peptide synthetase [Cutibacterium sp. WCA-380-WT-3A]|uniref:Peptide synthetase n=1 Tax=Cutibacterium porci TaxID=2605781 RepID=A0A7K0J3V4_9ACTN|nr:peptide synthetase [Cutibacterium porci]MSS44620.1 peptide synthetase [Cutibacterium porci]